MLHNTLPSLQNGPLRGQFVPGYNPTELVICDVNERLIDHAKPVHVAATTLRAIRATPTRRSTQMAVDCLSLWQMCEGGYVRCRPNEEEHYMHTMAHAGRDSHFVTAPNPLSHTIGTSPRRNRPLPPSDGWASTYSPRRYNAS